MGSDVRPKETPQRYAEGLAACGDVSELRAHVEAFADLAVDALRIVQQMTDADWPEFSRGLKSERRGRFAGEEWARRYVAVLMPEPMFTVARIAGEYHAPFAVALRRIKDVRPELLDVQPKA
jgi:hypothetical protein